MVKLDTSRDYYGDLELPPTCSAEDVKKQFRKLAFKYHPDRNPGKELEFQPRFQAIQAAHEVLTDAEQRNKYDAVRLRGDSSSTFQRPTPPPRATNPYTAYSDFPPPPRRTGPAAGANRYANFAPPPTRKDPTSSGQDAKARTQNFNAWQNMQNKQKAQGSRNQGYDSTEYQRPSQRNRNPSNDEAKYGSSPPKSSAWEHTRRQTSNAERPQPPPPPPRKAGFDPSDPKGDEAAAPSYYDRAHRPRMPGSFPSPQNPPRPQAPTARRPDLSGPASMDPPFVEGTRIRTPYATHYTEEKTYFSTDDLRRSASTRDTTNLHRPDQRNGQTSHLHPNRPRSASPPRETTNRSETRKRPGDGNTHRPIITESSSESTSTDESEVKGSRATPARPKVQPSATWKNRNGGPALGKAKSFEHSPSSTSGQAGGDGARDQPRPTIFTFPIHPDTFTPTSEPLQSSGNIDTNFSSGHTPIPFFSTSSTSAGPPRRESHPTDGPPRGRYPNRSDQPSPASDLHSSGPVPTPHFAHDAPTPSPGGATFSADQWSNENWATRWASPLSAPPLAVSPTRQAANSRRARGGGLRANSSTATRNAGTPKPASVEEEENGDPSAFTGSDVHDGPGSTTNDAMDIDPTPLAQSHLPPATSAEDTPPKQSPQQQKPRHVYVEPPRPEWQNLGVNGDRRASAPGFVPPPPPGPPPTTSPRPGVLDMHDLRHVHPLDARSAATGLGDLNDLADNLPFKSQASPTHADKVSSRFIKVELPNPPRAPNPPARLTSPQWNTFVSHMTLYIAAWNDFNKRIIGILQTRAAQQTEMEKGREGGMMDNWLGAFGETSQLGGWDTYVQVMNEDQRIRTHWQVACERHAQAVETHGKLRDYIIRNGTQKEA